jgi:ketosteroid isomerase-like protein
MPRTTVEIVRQRFPVREKSRRTLDQRLSLRFPRLAAASFHRILELPPHSRLRRAAMRRTAQLAVEAYNRRDLAAAVVGARPDFEYHPEPKWIEAGLVEPVYRGLEGYRKYVATVDEVWAGENFLKPGEIIDLGDRLVVLSEGRMRAQASGVPLTEQYALVITLKDGQIFHLQELFDHAAALKTVGLSE